MPALSRVLVLGGTGMLGSMLRSVLSDIPGLKVRTSQRRDRSAAEFFDAMEADRRLDSYVRSSGGADYVINAIGLTQAEIQADQAGAARKAEALNAVLPKLLAECAMRVGFRVIHISTDGIFSGRRGPYDENAVPDPEDLYGKTKLAGEVRSPRVLTLRCSIIGPDPVRKRGLFEWFRGLRPGSKVKGFTDQLWNGVTTLQFAALCGAVIETQTFDRLTAVSPLRHFCPNDAVTKFELLNCIKEALASDVLVEPAASGTPVNRVLQSRWSDLIEIVQGPRSVRRAVMEMMRHLKAAAPTQRRIR